MAKVSQVYASQWLTGNDLPKTIKAKVVRAGIEEFTEQDGTVKQRIVVDFAGAKKRLICNKTQATTFAELGGDDTNGWDGLEVFLAPTLASNGKKTISVMGIPSDDAAPDPSGENPF